MTVSATTAEPPQAQLLTSVGKPHETARISITVDFRSLGVQLHARGGQQVSLLQAVTGSLLPGQMTAIMGPSGSGKTTLLDVLSGRKSTGRVTGELTYNGLLPSKSLLRAATGYVEQQTSLISHLSVYEMLLYTAELKRSWREPRSKTAQVVDSLLKELNLEACAHVTIGDATTKGISGGQAKRVSIGVAMVCVPPVLYLDEPTSGLDSQSATEVMALVHRVAQEGTTVASTIHAPSTEVFALFGSVLVLAQGQVIYFGPTTDTCFQKRYRTMACRWLTDADPEGALPFPELLLEVAACATTGNSTKELAVAHNALQEAEPPHSKVNRSQTPPSEVSSTTSWDGSRSSWGSRGRLADIGVATTPTLITLLLLLKHRALHNWRRPAWHITRMLERLVLSLVIVSVYYGKGRDFSSGNLGNLSASLFLWVALPSVAAFQYIPQLIGERPLFHRERADGLYGPLAYLAYHVLEELTPAAVVSAGFSALVYFTVDYKGAFVLFWLAYFFTIAASICIGYLAAVLAPAQDVAHASLSVVIVSFLFTCGHFATVHSLPVYWTWWSRVNFLRYAWTAVMHNQFSDQDPVMTADGATVLQHYGLASNKWAMLGALSAFSVGYFVLGVMGLKFINHVKR